MRNLANAFFNSKSAPIYVLCLGALAFCLVGIFGGSWFAVWRGGVMGLFFAIPALILAIYKSRKTATQAP
jgi:hypothetical protein